jgi:hypothetical protein
MIKLINHLFGTELIRDNFYLSQYKNIIFETDDMNMVKILIPVRLMYNFDIYNIDFKLENINSLGNIEEPYMFISKYQILWDKLYLENINA